MTVIICLHPCSY